MKTILGLDLGTNSIGWALVSIDEENKPCKIDGMGSRIIPMSQEILGKFDRGNSISQTAERTGFRGVRRLRERYLLRRERLHRVLHIMQFLPEHYAEQIDFKKRLGQFFEEREPKIAWKKDATGAFEFLFKKSFLEMTDEFKANGQENNIPYDWTIYYLRKKALQHKIEKEELAWVILNFNQKRGYYQLRGEEDEEETPNRLVEYYALEVVDVTADESQRGKADIWYNVVLKNGWVYRRSSKNPLFDWVGKEKEFIVTTDLNDDGTVKTDKEGAEKRFFRSPSPDDWGLLKKKTEADIDKSKKTVGVYIYETLLSNPNQKIKGKLVRTIERKFYKDELKQILERQKEFHPELNDKGVFERCINELYPHNELHRNTLQNCSFTKLFLDDIIFYQRPLKSKKSLISNCPYEFRVFKNKDGICEKSPIKCITKSNPLFQEFRLWQFIHNLRIYEREKEVGGKLQTDVDVTSEFLPTIEDRVKLFDWLNNRKEIKQDTLLNAYFSIRKKRGEEKLPYRWNYVEDKEYPCNETRGQMRARLAKADVNKDLLSKDTEYALWHILYSVEDKNEIEKALKKFAHKHELTDAFVEQFVKFPPFKKDYGSYSEKVIKKLLPLMRMGKYWNQESICCDAINRLNSIIERLEYLEQNQVKIENVADDEIPKQVLRSFYKLTSEDKDFYSGLNTYQACYAVYGRHSESSETTIWKTPQAIDDYLKEFKQHSLRNPIVEQVITETLRMVRDIWKKYGDLSEIHIELGREMKNPAEVRAKMTQQNSDNESTNLRIRALLTELKNRGLSKPDDVENVRPYSPNQQEILRIYEEGALISAENIDDDILKISKSSQPTEKELTLYKLWLEQKYRSPYTGEMIPLGKLFTSAYQIEHVIPQSRFFDDSLSNKVICEAEVNRLKDNQLGYEFIKNHAGEKVELNFGKTVNIFTIDGYEKFVKDNYRKNQSKMRKLLLEDIPDGFIERQLNDSRYISKVVKELLSNIVREENEQEAMSKNVIACTGGITSRLKQDWGLNDVWNRIITPRFERLNQLTNSNRFGEWVNKDGKRVFQTEMPPELQKGFNKKRIDHRHHALDALIIACATRSHINYINNESARKDAKITRYDLRKLLCFKTRPDEQGNYKWQFYKPWKSFTQDTQATLENIIVSFKQNLRVINKSVNYIQSYKDENGVLQTDKNCSPIKTRRKQVKGDNWAIRKPLHTPMPYSKKTFQFDVLKIHENVGKLDTIIDEDIKEKVRQEYERFNRRVTKAQEYLRKNPLLDKNEKPIVATAFKIFVEKYRKRIPIARLSDRGQNGIKNADGAIKLINKISDLKIRKDLLQHLDENSGDIDKAFDVEGIEGFNNKRSIPIYRLPIAEKGTERFAIGARIGSKHKWGEAEKGTNLFFAIYVNNEGTRSYETIPLNMVVERLKYNLKEVPETDDNGSKLLFYLSPNDLVYLPTEDEIENGVFLDFSKLDNERKERLFIVNDFSGVTIYFTPNRFAKAITPKELDANFDSKTAKYGPLSIKQFCIKVKADRIGNITGNN